MIQFRYTNKQSESRADDAALCSVAENAAAYVCALQYKCTASSAGCFAYLLRALATWTCPSVGIQLGCSTRMVPSRPPCGRGPSCRTEHRAIRRPPLEDWVRGSSSSVRQLHRPFRKVVEIRRVAVVVMIDSRLVTSDSFSYALMLAS